MRVSARLSVLTLTFVGCFAGAASAQTLCQGEASYEVTFKSNWIDASHEGAVPSNAHFSPMIVATHNDKGVVFELGGLASAGVKQLAETGKTDRIKQELDADFKAGDVRAYRTGKRIDARDSSTVTLSVAPDRPRLSFLSMIAPSPDWIVGMPGLPLCNKGAWISDLTLNLPAIDAGTDSGGSLTADNFATVPPQPIRYLGKDFRAVQRPDSRFGTLTIKKQ